MRPNFKEKKTFFLRCALVPGQKASSCQTMCQATCIVGRSPGCFTGIVVPSKLSIKKKGLADGCRICLEIRSEDVRSTPYLLNKNHQRDLIVPPNQKFLLSLCGRLSQLFHLFQVDVSCVQHISPQAQKIIVCVDCSWVFDPEDGIVADASWCHVLDFVWEKMTFGSVS